MLTSGFFNGEKIGVDEYGAIYDRMYQAEFFSRYFSSFISNGVFGGDSTSFQVVENSGMSLRVKVGRAFINGYFCYSDEDIILNLDESDGLEDRIDRIVLQLNMTDREISLKVLKGDVKTPPEAKEITRSGDIYELAIADILIQSATPNIENSKITDLRLNNELCGFVTHLLEKVDTTTLYNQIQEDLKEFKEVEEANFLKWFENIRNLLNENAVSEHISSDFFNEKGVHNLRYNETRKKFEGYDQTSGTWEVLKGVGGGDLLIGSTKNIIIRNLQDKVSINWEDPKDIEVNGESVKKWKGTRVVKKAGLPPENYEDGELLIDNTEKNRFKNECFFDEDVQANTVYYYGLFPYDEDDNFNTSSDNIIKIETKQLTDLIYSFELDLNEKNPFKNIIYLDDSTEYTTPESWDTCPLFQNIRPCILNKDGTVNYYIQVEDYDYKENGELSNRDGSDGDFMLEFPPIVYRAEKTTEDKIKFSLTCNNDSLSGEDWTKLHLDYQDGEKYGKKFYISGYLCDISDKQNFVSRKMEEIDYTKLNATIKEIFTALKNKNSTSFIAPIYFQKLLLLILWLRFKTTDINTILNFEIPEKLLLDENEKYTIGSLTKGGLFSGCGSAKPQQAVKICGIEFFPNYYKSTGEKKTLTVVGSASLSTWVSTYYATHYIRHSYNNKYIERNDGVAYPVVKEYTTGGNGEYTWTYFNDFKTDNKIGFVPFYNNTKTNSTKNTFLCLGSFFGRQSSGDTAYIWDINPKNDTYGFILYGNTGNNVSQEKFSFYYMFIPPNPEQEGEEN